MKDDVTIAKCPNPECGQPCELNVQVGPTYRVQCTEMYCYIGPSANTKEAAIRKHNLICRRPAEDGLAREPVASKDLITLTGNQAEAILEAFGGEPTTVSIRRMEASKDVEDGSDMPAGLYLYYTEYPDEGVIFLGEDDTEYKPFYINRSPPLEPFERLVEEWRASIKRHADRIMRKKHIATTQDDWDTLAATDVMRGQLQECADSLAELLKSARGTKT